MQRRNRVAQIAASVGAVSVLFLAACSNDESSTSSSASSTTASASTEVPSTTAPGAVNVKTDLESLSYLLQRLLTTKEIGNGWIDQGRNLVPPQTENLRAGGLCPAGEKLLAPIGGRFNDLVMATYRKDETPAKGIITEGLTWGPRAEVEADFATLKAANEACYGAAYLTPNNDSQKLDPLNVPSLGTSSFASHQEPGTAITDNPWAEVDGVMILLSDPSFDVAVVINLTYMTVHEPGKDAPSPDVAELTRVAKLAIEKNMTPP